MLYVGVGLMVYDVCRKFINLLSVKIWCLQTNFEWSLIDWLIIFIVRIWYLCVCVCICMPHARMYFIVHQLQCPWPVYRRWTEVLCLVHVKFSKLDSLELCFRQFWNGSNLRFRIFWIWTTCRFHKSYTVVETYGRGSITHNRYIIIL